MNITHFTMFAYGFVSAWICFQIQAEALRRITRRRPRHDRSGPTTPKPQFPPGRVTDVHGETIGYRSINYPDPLPGRRPTNPFNGERIPNPPPRKP